MHAEKIRRFEIGIIRVLPIARRTKHVDGTQADGSADAQLNVEDLIKTFGASYNRHEFGRDKFDRDACG